MNSAFARPDGSPAQRLRTSFCHERGTELLLLIVVAAVYSWNLLLHPLDLGLNVDSDIYLNGAASLAHGHGYHEAAASDHRAIALYPPLQSAYLALFWWLDPSTPLSLASLHFGMILLGLAATVLTFRFFRRMQLPLLISALLTTTWMLSPNWFTFLAVLVSEPLFVVIELGILLAWASGSSLSITWRWFWTGIGLTALFLTRTVALVFVGVTGIIALREAKRHNLVPCLALLPVAAAVGLWTWWTRQAHSASYATALFARIGAHSSSTTLWRTLGANAISYLGGGAFLDAFAPSVLRSFQAHHLARWGLAAPAHWLQPVFQLALVVLVALGFATARKRLLRILGCYCACYLLVLLLWPWQLAQRAMTPLVPVLLLAAWHGSGHLRFLLRVNQPVKVALHFALGLAAAGNLVLLLGMPRVIAQWASLPELREVANWFRRYSRPSAIIECSRSTSSSLSAIPTLQLSYLLGRTFPNGNRSDQGDTKSGLRPQHYLVDHPNAARTRGMSSTRAVQAMKSSHGSYVVWRLLSKPTNYHPAPHRASPSRTPPAAGTAPLSLQVRLQQCNPLAKNILKKCSNWVCEGFFPAAPRSWGNAFVPVFRRSLRAH